jgi:hypothetical protein
MFSNANASLLRDETPSVPRQMRSAFDLKRLNSAHTSDFISFMYNKCVVTLAALNTEHLSDL